MENELLEAVENRRRDDLLMVQAVLDHILNKIQRSRVTLDDVVEDLFELDIRIDVMLSD